LVKAAQTKAVRSLGNPPARADDLHAVFLWNRVAEIENLSDKMGHWMLRRVGRSWLSGRNIQKDHWSTLQIARRRNCGGK
jgi:hypothetical protein